MRNRITTASLFLLVLSASACSTQSPQLLPEPVIVTPAVQIPPLPASARQPSTPLECSPDCLTNLTRARKSMRDTLTDRGQQD